MRLQDMTVLVTGAAGFVGSAVVRKLAGEGTAVRALVHSPEKVGLLPKAGAVTTILGDITDRTGLEVAMAGCDVVIHTAAALHGSYERQRAINIDGTRNVMRVASAVGAGRVVHMSSIAVYGYRHTEDIAEDMPLSPGKGAYTITKAQAESVVREFSRSSGVSFAIMRPGTIFGPGGRGWTVGFFRRAARRPILLPGDGSGTMPCIYVGDVADLAVVLATHPAASGEAFNAVLDPAPTLREYLTAYNRLAGDTQPLWLSVSPWFVRLAAHLRAGLADPAEYARDAVDMMNLTMRRVHYKMDKARHLLGWEPAIDMEKGVRLSADYLREQGVLKR